MALLTAQKLGVSAGVTLTFAAAAGGGDTFKAEDDLSRLLVKNDSAGSINVTITVPATVAGLAVSSRVVAVAAGAIRAIPLLMVYVDPADGLLDITYSAVTTVTVAVVRA